MSEQRQKDEQCNDSCAICDGQYPLVCQCCYKNLQAELDEAINIIERYHRQACNTHQLAESWLDKVRKRG